MNSLIRKRLLDTEDHLLDAILQDPPTLGDFCGMWQALLEDFKPALTSDSVDEETIELAYTISSRVKHLAEGTLDLSMRCKEITSDLMTRLGDIFAQLSVTDVSPTAKARITPLHLDISASAPPSPSDLPATDISSSFPPYIAPAHKWLLKNLHNPYPSNEVKESLSRSTGASIKQINAWFINVRRRVGWTALSRKHFDGSYTETVDAAYRAFVKEDPKRPLLYTVLSEFETLKVAAEDLYSDKLRKSVLAGKLDSAVRDTTDEDRVKRGRRKTKLAEDEKRRQDNEKESRKRERANDKVFKSSARSFYPSPDRSSYGSPEPSPSTQEEEEEGLAPPERVAGRKRRQESEEVQEVDKPNKRFRCVLNLLHSRYCVDVSLRPNEFSCDLTFDQAPTFPPSPKSPPVRSTNIVDYEDPAPVQTGLASGVTAVNVISVSRKRRLSDADAHPIPKRPRGLVVAPRPQAVSDPLPTSIAVTEASDFDAWFRRNFDVPDAVTLQEPDPSTPVEVELFRDWTYHDGDLSENEDAAARGRRTTCIRPSTSLTFGAVAFPMTHQIELLESELQTITPRLIDLSSLPDLILDDSIEPIQSDPGATATHEPSSLFSTTAGSSSKLFTLNYMDSG
jgi:C-terminal domain of homeodomain 1/Homeobox KN domain